MKFATKPTWHYPPHLSHVATLPWDIKNSNFLQIFRRYRKDANKLLFQCTDFNSCAHVTCMLSVFMCLTRSDKVTESLKVGTFFETQCSFWLLSDNLSLVMVHWLLMQAYGYASSTWPSSSSHASCMWSGWCLMTRDAATMVGRITAAPPCKLRFRLNP